MRIAENDERTDAHRLLILCLCGFATSISWRALDPMLPVMAADLDVPLNQAVLLASAYSLPFALMQLVFGPIGDAWGKTRLIRTCLGIVAASLLLMALAPNFYSAVGARALTGAFAGGINPVAVALLSEHVPYDKRQVVLGRYMIAMIGGQMFGAAAAGLLVDLIGWRLVFALAAVIIAGVCALTVVRLHSQHETRSRPSLHIALTSYRSIFARPGAFLIIGSLMAEGTLVMGLIPFVAGMLLQHHASSSAQAGIVIGCFAVGGIAFGFLVRHAVDGLGPSRMIRVGGVLAGGGLAGAGLPLHWIVSAGCFFLLGFGFYMMHNTIMLRVTELSPQARGAGVSAGAFAFTAGQGFGPMLWAVVAGATTYSRLFLIAGLLTFGLSLVVARFMRPNMAAS